MCNSNMDIFDFDTERLNSLVFTKRSGVKIQCSCLLGSAKTLNGHAGLKELLNNSYKGRSVFQPDRQIYVLPIVWKAGGRKCGSTEFVNGSI